MQGNHQCCFFTQNPSYSPTGTWSAYENRGMSGQGVNTQVTDRKKRICCFTICISQNGI